MMADLIDDRDRMMSGYERHGCLLYALVDRPDHPLVWRSEGRCRDRSLERVRFYARASAIHALTGTSNTSEAK